MYGLEVYAIQFEAHILGVTCVPQSVPCTPSTTLSPASSIVESNKKSAIKHDQVQVTISSNRRGPR